LSAQDAVTAALLFLGLAALFAFTRSHWLDDWDSVNFAFGLDDFDVTKHWPHPPGYPVYIAAGKLVYSVIADHAAALTLVSALSAASVASMFYGLERRHSDRPVTLCATLIMARRRCSGSSRGSRSPTCSAWCLWSGSCWLRGQPPPRLAALSQSASLAVSSPDCRSVRASISPS